MGKFDGILIGTDLDGTLLRHDKSVSEENKKAIEYFKSEGGIFTFFTGRIPVASKPVLEQVMPNGPFGCINGAGICDVGTGKLVWSLSLADGYKEIAEYVDKNHPCVGIEVTTDVIYCNKTNDITRKHLSDEHVPEIMCDYRTFDEPVCKLLFGVPEEYMEGFMEDIKKHPLSERFEFIRSDKCYFEVLPAGASKGNLLVKIAELCGIDIKNTIAVGDNENDVSMLKAAGKGIVVANAFPVAKAAADLVTVSNEEHAIAKIVDDLEKGIIKL